MAGADEDLIGRRHEFLDDFALFVPQLNAEILTAIAERVVGEFIGLRAEAGEDLIEPASALTDSRSQSKRANRQGSLISRPWIHLMWVGVASSLDLFRVGQASRLSGRGLSRVRTSETLVLRSESDIFSTLQSRGEGKTARLHW